MSNYHILALDGGGIRGIISATILERLEEAHPGLIDEFDLFAGTSTGGILSLGMAFGLTPEQTRQLYEKCGEEVFADTLIDDVRDLGQLIGADYSSGPLYKVLFEHFNDTQLGELDKKVLVSTFDLDCTPTDPTRKRTWKSKFFHNYDPDDSDFQQTAVDVAMRTSAAPTYFPIYQGYIDGGVIAANPSVCALAQALHQDTGGQSLDDLVLLSVGTGQNPRFLDEEDSDWGLVQWAPHLVSLMLEGGSGTADYQCRQILGKRYLRIDPYLPIPISLDRVDQIPLMKEIANQIDLTQTIEWLEKYF